MLEAGDAVVAPAGAPHAAWNAGYEEVHALVDFRPALRTETAFETLAGLAQDGKTTSVGAPKNPFQLALVFRHFEDEIYMARPPLAVQRVLFGAVAAVGRLLGYRPEYPYPLRGPGGGVVILVTGATGSAGGAVVRTLASADERVRALVRPGADGDGLPAAAEPVEGT